MKPETAAESQANARRMGLSEASVALVGRNFGRTYQPPASAPGGDLRIEKATDGSEADGVPRVTGAWGRPPRDGHPLVRYDAESLLVETKAEPQFRLLREPDLYAMPDLEELVVGLLPAHGSAMLYGPSGIGKSLVALDLALTISSNADEWHGHEIRPGAATSGTALYIAAEGAHGLPRRLRAWRTATEYTGPLAIRFLDVAVQLGSLTDPCALIDAVDAITATPDHHPDLLVVDTLSRCMAGLDENSAKDASRVVAGLDYLREQLGCTTLLIHHSGINETRERGSTVFRGAVDVLLSLKESDGVLTLEADKVRDGPPLSPLSFRLAPVADSMVVVATDVAADGDRPLSRVTEAVWQSLKAIATANGASCAEWEKSSGVSGRSFYRARKTLLDRGLVVCEKRRYKPVGNREVSTAS